MIKERQCLGQGKAVEDQGKAVGSQEKAVEDQGQAVGGQGKGSVTTMIVMGGPLPSARWSSGLPSELTLKRSSSSTADLGKSPPLPCVPTALPFLAVPPPLRD